MSRTQAAEIWGKSARSTRRYIQRFLTWGPQGLKDQRKSNYYKLTTEHEAQIVALKQEKPHRSARWIRDHPPADKNVTVIIDGRIPPRQNVRAGSYTDTLTIAINF